MTEQNYRHTDEVPGANSGAERIVPLILKLTTHEGRIKQYLVERKHPRKYQRQQGNS